MEIERLSIQARFWNEDAEILFDQIGIKPGWKCVDLGCGPMGVLEPLSRRVGPKGQVLGVDSNPENVQAAQDFIQKENLANVKILKKDIYQLALAAHSFDLTHERFIFSQIGCDRTVLESMIRLTKVGGVVASQESDWNTWICYPPHAEWEKMRNALIDFHKRDGGDINAAQRTYTMFKKAGLGDVRIRATIFALPIGHPYRSSMNQMAMSMKEKMIGANLFTEKEFDSTMDTCNQIIKDHDTIIFSYLLCQVWGRVIEKN